MAETPIATDLTRAAESNCARILGLASTFHALALAVVGLRLYARIKLIRSPGWDDWCMVGAAICAMGGLIVMVIQAFYGLGHHEDTLPKSDLTKFKQAGFWSSIISAGTAFGFLKCSIALNLLRLSINKWYKWILRCTMVVVILWVPFGWFCFFLHCRPMAGHWNKSLGANCYSFDLFIRLSILNTVYNITTDILFATIPIPIIWNLQMKRRVRLYVIAILSLGYAAVAMGIVKGVYQVGYGNEPDKTFNHNVHFWGYIQLQVGIIAACAPTLKPVVGKALKLTSGHTFDPSKIYENRTPKTGAGRRTLAGHTMLSRNKDHIELDDQTGYLAYMESGRKGNSTTFYKGDDPDQSGSEEMILHGGQGGQAQARGSSKGIMRTTEITVK